MFRDGLECAPNKSVAVIIALQVTLASGCGYHNQHDVLSFLLLVECFQCIEVQPSKSLPHEGMTKTAALQERLI